MNMWYRYVQLNPTWYALHVFVGQRKDVFEPQCEDFELLFKQVSCQSPFLVL
jgi:hypothetical protein